MKSQQKRDYNKKSLYFRFFDFSFLSPSVIFSDPWTWLEMLFIEYSIAAEKSTQVLDETLWTDPEAMTAMIKQNKDSGNFVWKPLPNVIFSKFPSPVKRNTNSIDPRNPPRMVAGWEAIKNGLAICIPLKRSTDNAKDTTQDGLFASAIFHKW